MNSIKDQLSFYGSALELRGKRNNILASNIANAVTPNYKARDVNFLDEFSKITKNGPLKSTHGDHIINSSKQFTNDPLYREPLVASLDGNTVELNVEQMQFAENTMRYSSTVNFLNGKINKIMSAIRGE